MILLAELRTKMGWSKAEVARRAQIHPSTYGMIENERMVPYDVQLMKIAEALGHPGDPQDLMQPID